eukprot:5781488-Prymnesium_polylepis.1
MPDWTCGGEDEDTEASGAEADAGAAAHGCAGCVRPGVAFLGAWGRGSFLGTSRGRPRIAAYTNMPRKPKNSPDCVVAAFIGSVTYIIKP